MLTPEWHKSSFSNATSNCVEARTGAPGVVQVRDSKDPNGPHLAFTSEEWGAFVNGVKEGTFRLPD